MGMRVTGGAGAVAATLMLTGCGGSAPAPGPTGAGEPTTSYTIVIPEGQIVATGAFTDATGHVAGDVAIAAAADATFVISITGFSTSIPTAEFSASGEPITPDQRCFTEPWRMGFGTHAGSDIELELPLDDPSFISAIALTTLPVESSADCALEYVGYANLTWDIPDLRPDLIVIDGGAIEHAQGAVAADDAGALVSYTTAEGDRLGSIVKRFGIDQDDLRYLNPTSPVLGGSSLDVPAGEILNLSKDNR